MVKNKNQNNAKTRELFGNKRNFCCQKNHNLFPKIENVKIYFDFNMENRAVLDCKKIIIHYSLN